MAQPDVLIVGGGVIGASIAYHLAEAGTHVMVLERGRAGGHASLASAGLLHPILSAGAAHPVRDLSLASFALFPNLVARLHEITGIDPEYQVPGFLMVALREDEVELHAAELSDPLAETYGLRLLSGDEARALEPGLSPRVKAAVHKPRGAQVYAPSLLQAYTHAAARLGATVRRESR
jgi:glycine oxidase